MFLRCSLYDCMLSTSHLYTQNVWTYMPSYAARSRKSCVCLQRCHHIIQSIRGISCYCVSAYLFSVARRHLSPTDTTRHHPLQSSTPKSFARHRTFLNWVRNTEHATTEQEYAISQLFLPKQRNISAARTNPFSGTFKANYFRNSSQHTPSCRHVTSMQADTVFAPPITRRVAMRHCLL